MKDWREVSEAVARGYQRSALEASNYYVDKRRLGSLAYDVGVTVHLKGGAQIICTSASWVMLYDSLETWCLLYRGSEQVARVPPRSILRIEPGYTDP